MGGMLVNIPDAAYRRPPPPHTSMLTAVSVVLATAGYGAGLRWLIISNASRSRFSFVSR